MPKMIVTALVTAPLMLAGSAGAQDGLPQHGHCLTVPSGKTIVVAPGVTRKAPHSTLERFHFNVHEPVQKDLLEGELQPEFDAEADPEPPFDCL